jgi:hypothetical protein
MSFDKTGECMSVIVHLSMPPAFKRGKMIHRIRVCYERMDEEFLYVRPMEFVPSDLLRVRYGIKGDNDFFDDLIPRLWTLAQLNLNLLQRNLVKRRTLLQ